MPKTGFSFIDMPAAVGTTGNTYHYGDICTSGILCGTGIPGTGTDTKQQSAWFAPPSRR